MGTDIVIINKDTQVILGIITDTSLDEGCNVVTNNLIDILEVDNSKSFILADEETGELKFKNPDNNSKVVYLDDYR